MTNEQLCLRIQAGEDVGKNMFSLYEQNKGLIYSIAKKYSMYGELEDLTQEGYIALDAAAYSYDPEAGAAFSTYAMKYIKGHLLKYLRKDTAPLHIPEYMQENARKYLAFVDQWQKIRGRRPRDREAVEYMEITPAQLKRIKEAITAARPDSLERPVSYDEDVSLSECVADDRNDFEGVEDRTDGERLQAALWGVVDDLPGQQPQILRLVYINQMTRQQAAAAIGAEPAAVRVQEQKALRTLRHPARMKKYLYCLDGYIYGSALRGNGVGRFNDTWTSSTERTALRLAEGF